jgi:hypothetical protein
MSLESAAETSAFPADSLACQMQTVKGLYTELFMLLLDSVERGPADTAVPSADGAIDRLMQNIDGSMQDFLATVRTARNEQTAPAALDGEIRQFEDQLKEGLQLMHGRVERRMAAMARERDELKNRLQMVQRKRGGSRGYRKGLVVSIGGHEGPVQASA